MDNVHLLTPGEDRQRLTVSALAENPAYRNENRDVMRSYSKSASQQDSLPLNVMLNARNGQPLLCFRHPKWQCRFALPISLESPFSSLPDWMRTILSKRLGTSVSTLHDDILLNAARQAWCEGDFTVPVHGVALYQRYGVTLLTSHGPYGVTPEKGLHRHFPILTPFFAPSSKKQGGIDDPMIHLIDETLPYAQEAIALLPYVASDHPTEPLLMRWLLACSYVAGQPLSHWCAPACEAMTATLRR
jgi:hypothetical protein